MSNRACVICDGIIPSFRSAKAFTCSAKCGLEYKRKRSREYTSTRRLDPIKRVQMIEATRRWAHQNPDKVKDYGREYHRRHYAQNKNKLSVKNAAYREGNRERIRAQQRQKYHTDEAYRLRRLENAARRSARATVMRQIEINGWKGLL